MAELLRMVFPEPIWGVPAIIPEGFTLLAGKAKIGKTFLAINIAYAMASGGKAFGHIDVEPGRVLYIGL